LEGLSADVDLTTQVRELRAEVVRLAANSRSATL
jgi:hypothetical protein